MKPGDLVQRFIFNYSFNKLGTAFNFSYIPAGTFTMGSPMSDTDSEDDERPQHQVTITKPFLMLRTQVTQVQWSTLMSYNFSAFKGPNYPVQNVNWDDAVDFCNLLSIRAGLVPAYTNRGSIRLLNEGANGYRLPTEAEWEYACRAGTTTLRYGDIDDIAWYGKNSESGPHEVAQKKPNSWNLYDMLGNVSEWTQDWAGGNYSTGSRTDPQGPETGSFRVIRGGSWFGAARDIRAAGYRNYGIPEDRTGGLGFRICRNLE